MAKNKKTAPVVNPAPKAETTIEPVVEQPQAVVSGNNLDANRTVDLIRIQHETFRMDPKAAEKYHMSQETVDKINEVNAIAQVVVMAQEINKGNTQFAITMKASQFETIRQIAEHVGVNFDGKALPSPDGSIIEIKASDIKISKETKESLENEAKIQENEAPEPTPADISSKDELHDVLQQITVKNKSVFDRITKPIEFYREYCVLNAKDATEKALIKEKTKAQLFDEMHPFLGKMTILVNGIGRFLYNTTSETKSPVRAFCVMRDVAKDKKTGNLMLSEQEIAEIVTILIKWTVKHELEHYTSLLSAKKSELAQLKPKMPNSANIKKQLEAAIASLEKNITHVKSVLEILSDTANDYAAQWPELYAEKDSAARKTFNAVVQTYYGENAPKDTANLKHNVQQHIGIIQNMFRDPITRNDEYNTTKLIPITTEEQPEAKEEETKK